VFVFPHRLVVGDVSVIHLAAVSVLCMTVAWDTSRLRAYRQVSSALPFVPMSVESFGRLGALALTLLGDLADQAVQASGPGLSRAAIISGALRELNVALCQATVSLCWSGAYAATRASPDPYARSCPALD
jgi:hypothetical protein